jgi:autotransporter-associated beta strand protein
MKTTNPLINNSRLYAVPSIALTLGVAALANAQELITNGDFSNGLTGWGSTDWGTGGGSFGTNANGPTDTSAASGNYAYAGGGVYNLLTQSISGLTTGNAYRLTFLAGGKSGQGNANGVLSLYDGLAGSYNSASFDYGPSDAAFGSYTVDFTARGATDLWLRSDSSYAAYDNVSVTAIGSVANALNYSSASGYSQITSALTGSGKVTSNAGTGGLTLTGANTHTGGTEVTGGTLFVTGAGTLGAASGNVTVSGGGILDLRNQQTRTGTISMTNQDARILSGDVNNPGSIVNNGGAFQFGGGLLNVPLSGTGGLNVTGGGMISSNNSYTGATTISATLGWYGQNQLFVNNANALGAALGDLTISGGYVNLQNNTITRSGNLTISGGSVETGTVSKSGSAYDIQGGSVGAVLAGTAGLTKSGSGTAALTGTNTYSGNTTINGGTLSVYSAGGLGNATGAVTVNTGATLYTHSGLTLSRTGDVTVNGGNLTTDNNNFGTISVSGGNFIANNAAVLAVKLAGTAGLTVGGTGETYLWTDSSYTGATVISSGQLTLGGFGAISSQSRLQIDSGAAVNLTGAYAANNINRTFAGLTGAGVLYGEGGTVTVNKTSDTDIFSGDIQGAQGLIKDGAGTLALSGASTYTGATTVNTGILTAAHANALGSTAGGTTVASGAQLRLQGVTVGNEALTISGNGTGGSTGALRSGTGSNTYQGKVTLGGDAKIFSGSGTSITLDVASGDAVDLASYTLTIEGAGTHTVSDAIVGTGGLTKTGSGITTLAGTNTYTGTTTVSLGTLAVNGSVAGAMTVGSSGTLQGNGTISGATIVSGNLKPGNSPGLLTFANSLTLDSTATTTMEITGANSSGTRGTTYDAVNVTNALTYGGTLALNFDALFTQTGNYTFNLFDSASTSGSFGSVSLAGVYSGSFTNTNDSGIWGLTQGDNTWSFKQSDGVLSFAVVPEPNVAMVAGSLALMALLRRRRD